MSEKEFEVYYTAKVSRVAIVYAETKEEAEDAFDNGDVVDETEIEILDLEVTKVRKI